MIDGSPSRVARDTKLVNVYAILRGTDPAQSKRIYLVTGHYDTRITNTTTTTASPPAPTTIPAAPPSALSPPAS